MIASQALLALHLTWLHAALTGAAMLPQWELQVCSAPEEFTCILEEAAYSPDGRKIAVLMDYYRERSLAHSELVVISVSERPLEVQRVRLEAAGGPLDWSPGSSSVAFQSRRATIIIRGPDGSQCRIDGASWLGGFIGESSLLRVPLRLPAGKLRTREGYDVVIHDTSCRVTGGWPYALAGVPSIGVNASPPLVVIAQRLSQPVLLEAFTGTVVRRINNDTFVPEFKFGDRGEVLCVGQGVVNYRDSVMRCFDLEDGLEFSSPPIHMGGPFDIAREKAVLIGTDQSIAGRHLFSRNHKRRVKDWVVWDIRKGREIARFKHVPQGSGLKPPLNPSGSDTPSAGAISPDGRTIVIGTDSWVRCYRLPPS